MFTAPTYLVLDLPAEIGAEVTALRSRYDAFMAGLPPEITVAGSSGIGALVPGQSQEVVFEAVGRVVAKHLPITTVFVSIECFPGTDVFWLKPIDRAPFEAIQAALVAEGLRFLPSPFPFNPHCTVSASAPLLPGQEESYGNPASRGRSSRSTGFPSTNWSTATPNCWGHSPLRSLIREPADAGKWWI